MLHSVARRYLMDRSAELHQAYAKLPNGGRAEDGYHSSTQALRIFPRYHVVDAILVEIERLDPDDLPAPESLAAVLVRAAAGAQSLFTQPRHGDLAAEAIADERHRFATGVPTWLANPDLRVAPVGYRRVLSAEESTAWHGRLGQRWGVHRGSWYPMLQDPVPDDALILVEAAMWDGDGVRRVRDALRGIGGTRVVELREYGADYLLNIGMFAPTYNGAEGLWSDDSLAWIAFASHEDTVTFGGVLGAALQATWPNLDEWRWPASP
jgi:hypothetical protein